MLGFLRLHGGVGVLTAACVAIGAVGGAVAVYVYSPALLPSAPTAPEATIAQPAPPSSAEAPSSAPLAGMPAEPSGATVADASSAAPSRPSAAADDGVSKGHSPPAAAPSQAPEFDVVRVGPSGDSVIAGRGAPGATIALVDGDSTLASAVADANGEVVFLPPTLTPGKHALRLKSAEPGGQWAMSRTVAVAVPEIGKDRPTAALAAAPDKPSATQPDSSASKPSPMAAPAAPASGKKAPAVAIRSAEAEEGGSFTATGVAPPGSQSRLYLNGAFLGKVIADLNGLWSLKVEKGMRPGSYNVRADEVEPGSGKVIARAEVPFTMPAPSAAAAGAEGPVGQAASKSPEDRPRSDVAASLDSAKAISAPTIIKEIRTATVVRGDSLWRISRKMLGHGIRYVQIYEANEDQIRNPNLVFPGQVFVMPSDPG